MSAYIKALLVAIACIHAFVTRVHSEADSELSPEKESGIVQDEATQFEKAALIHKEKRKKARMRRQISPNKLDRLTEFEEDLKARLQAEQAPTSALPHLSQVKAQADAPEEEAQVSPYSLSPNSPNAWPHEQISGLRPDPRAHTGVLQNGIRYVIYPNKEPRERVLLWIRFAVGSLMEAPEDHGIAHYLEHMAFNGSEHYSERELTEFLQRMGMAFGADTNAHTSFVETAYKLNIPDNSDAYLREGFQVLRDWTDKLLLSQKEIDQERGVILSEKRARDSAAYRAMMKEIKFATQGHRVSERDVLGTEESINSLQKPTFEAFYKKWYRPERMTLFVVGDTSVEQIEPLMQEFLADAQAQSPEPEDMDWGKLDAQGIKADFYSDDELSEVSVSLSRLTDHLAKDSRVERIRSLRASLAYSMLNRRFEKQLKEGSAPFMSAYASPEKLYNFFNIFSLELACLKENWEASLQKAEQELRKALLYGFTEAELVEAKANTLNSFEEALRQAPTRSSMSILGEFLSDLSRAEVTTSAEADLTLAREALETVSKEEVLALLREDWNADPETAALPDLRIFVSGNMELPEGKAGQTQILDLYYSSRSTAVEAPEDTELKPFAYTQWGKPGRIETETYLEDLDIYQIQFENGVRVNLKRTDFKENQILMALRIGNGGLQFSSDESDSAAYMTLSSLLTAGGVGQHTQTEIESLLAGKNAYVSAGGSEDAFYFDIGTTPRDLGLSLDVLCAYITDPAYRNSIMATHRKNVEATYDSIEHSVGAAFNHYASKLLASGDTRFGLPRREYAMTAELTDLKPLIENALRKDYLEASFVGDFDLDAMREELSRTLGALPKRDTSKPALKEARQVFFPEDRENVIITVYSDIDKAIVSHAWPVMDAYDVQASREMDLLSAILENKLLKRIREEMGAAYNVQTILSCSETYDGYGILRILTVVDPLKVRVVSDEIDAIVRNILESGVSEDDFIRARAPILRQVRDQMRNNGYWMLCVLDGSQERPTLLERARSLQPFWESVQKDATEAIARKYLSVEDAKRIYVIPQKELARVQALLNQTQELDEQSSAEVNQHEDLEEKQLLDLEEAA